MRELLTSYFLLLTSYFLHPASNFISNYQAEITGAAALVMENFEKSEWKKDPMQPEALVKK
jgi:hypothetical protein